MEVFTILVMIVAVISAAATNAIVQRRLLAAGHGWLRSTAVSGLTGFLAMIAIVASYFIVGQAIWKLSH